MAPRPQTNHLCQCIKCKHARQKPLGLFGERRCVPSDTVSGFFPILLVLINHLVPSLRRKIAEGGGGGQVMKCFSICIPESLHWRLPSLFVLRQETAAVLTTSIQTSSISLPHQPNCQEQTPSVCIQRWNLEAFWLSKRRLMARSSLSLCRLQCGRERHTGALFLCSGMSPFHKPARKHSCALLL